MKSIKFPKIVIIKYYILITFQAVGWMYNKENRSLFLMNDLNVIDNLMIEVDCI